MGTEEFYRFNAKENAVKACANMLIVATAEHVAAVVEADSRHNFPGLETFGCENDQPISASLIAAAQVLVVEVDPDMPRSIERLIELGRQYPGLPRIAAIANGSVPLVRTLVREGVSDVVSLPFQIEGGAELNEDPAGGVNGPPAEVKFSLRTVPEPVTVQLTSSAEYDALVKAASAGAQPPAQAAQTHSQTRLAPDCR